MAARRKAVHPGAIVARALVSQGRSQAELSRATGYSRKHINRVVNGKANLSAACAVAIGAELGLDHHDLMTASVAWQFRQAHEDNDAARRAA